MKDSADFKSKFDVFLEDGKGKPVSELSESKLSVRQLLNMLLDKLDIYQIAEFYMDFHFSLGEPDESDRLFFQTLIMANKDQQKTALGLLLEKNTVAQRLFRLKQRLARTSGHGSTKPACGTGRSKP